MSSVLTMAEDKVKRFLDNPTPKGLDTLRKDELLQAAEHFGVPASSISRKAEIRDKVTQWLYYDIGWKEINVF